MAAEDHSPRMHFAPCTVNTYSHEFWQSRTTLAVNVKRLLRVVEVGLV